MPLFPRLNPFGLLQQTDAAIGVFAQCQKSLGKWPAPAPARHRHRAFAWKINLVDGEGSRFRDVSWPPEEVLDILDMIAERAPRIGTEAEAREAWTA
jgi:hypothetical protein